MPFILSHSFCILTGSSPLCGPQLVGDPCKVALFPTQPALARPPAEVRRPHARPRHVVTVHTCSPYFAIRPGLQRLGCCSGGFSAPPADPAPAVPLAMASAVPTTGSALPRPCLSTLEASTSPRIVSAFTAVPAGLGGQEIHRCVSYC